MSKRAVILAGGQGTRLKPYTTVFPKPLVPVGEYPILEIIVRQLVRSGYKHITMAINYKAHLIKAFFGDGSQWNAKIDYSIENIPLGTMGPLKLIKDLPEHFLVMNGDVLTDIDFSLLYEFHVARGSLFTIACCQREQRSEFGVLDIADNRLVGFREKPLVHYTVSMGVYMVNKKVLDYIPTQESFGFDHLMLKLIALNEHTSTYQHKGIWLDIGRSEDYVEANERFEELRKELFV